MGLPNGLYGVPTTLAARLKSIWSHLFIKRLRSSHVTIETEIMFHNLAGTDSFKTYMDQICQALDRARQRLVQCRPKLCL
jgi:hypothetical protein